MGKSDLKRTSYMFEKKVWESFNKYCKERLIKKSGLINKLIKDFLVKQRVLDV